MASSTPSKQVFFGSLFEFSSTGVEDVRARFKECMLPRSVIPFVTYDRINNVFSFICDQQDAVAVQTFAGNLKEYLDHQNSLQHHVGQDFVESPKIKAFDGTVIQEHLTLGDSRAGTEGLINIVGAEDSDSEEENSLHFPRPDGMTSITGYWRPKDGSIDILTTSVAQQIAQLTGSSLDPEPARHRVRVWGNNHEQALQKLRNLEALLVRLASQRSSRNSKASDNLLLLRQDDLDVVIEYGRIRPEHSSYNRIIVDEAARPFVAKKCVGELRKREVFNGPLLPPKNLSVEPKSLTQINESKIWADRLFQKIGTDTNMVPRDTARPTTEALDPANGQASNSQTAPSKYLSLNASTKIQAWTQDINELADPGLAPEPPSETVAQKKTQRKVAADSDDDDDDDHDQEHDESKIDYETAKAAPSETTGLADRLATGASASSGSQHDESNGKRPSRQIQPIDLDWGDKEESEDGAVAEQSGEATYAIGQHASHFVRSSSPNRPGPIMHSTSTTEVVQPTITDTGHAKTLSKTARLIDIGSVESSSQVYSLATVPEASSESIQPILHTQAFDPPTTVTLPVPVQIPPSHSEIPTPPPTFDATRYGQPPPGCSTNRNTRAQLIRGNFGRGRSDTGQGREQSHQSIGRQPSRGSHSSFGHVPRGLSRPYLGRPQARGSRQRESNPQGQTLVEVSDSNFNQLSGPIIPPPGLDIRTTAPSHVPSLPEPVNLLDGPLENIQRPSLRPTPSQDETPSHTYGVRSGPDPSVSDLYVSTSNPTFDVSAREIEVLEQLLDMQRLQGSQGPQQPSNRRGGGPSQRRQTDDETSTRRLHRTMSQGAPNPGRTAPGQKQETKKERQERISRALADASPIRPRSGVRKDVAKTNDTQMSAKKKQTLKHNPGLAKDFGPAAQDITSSEQTESLLQALSPLFDAARAFPGELRFEIKIGQVLVPDTEIGRQYEVKSWNTLFHPKHGQASPNTSFTSILTTNGADVDRLLETKGLPHSGASKFWDKLVPGPSRVTYEFQCQNKENDECWLIFKDDGTYQLQKNVSTVGMVNLHYPGYVWDACATLQGRTKWVPSREIEAAAAVFADTLYVPPGQSKLAITYRLPTTNEITVRDLVMKRTSLHNCISEGKGDIQLQITEVKTLYYRFNHKDPALAQGFEKNFDQMRDEGRLHYEVSLVDTRINAGLLVNKELELGELTDPSCTGSALLDHKKTQDLLEVATYIVSKSDWMGGLNTGSLPRMYGEAARKDHERLQSLGPAAASRMGGSRVPASHFGNGPLLDGRVHGVRSNTVAELRQDDDGNVFYYGLGGARIPVAPEELALEDIDEEGEVVPDDSASMVAAQVRPQPQKPIHRQGQGLSPQKHGRNTGFW